MRKKIVYLLLLALVALPLEAKRKEKRTVVELTTTAGTIKVALYDETPIHRDNFTKLTEEGFYDGTLFHRVIKDFMIQAGDPTSKGAEKGVKLGEGDAEYTLPPEFQLPLYYHVRGALAMAREGDDVNPEQRSSGAQFYIVWGKRQTDMTLSQARARANEYARTPVEFTYDMRENYLTRGGAPHLDGSYTVFGEVIEGLPIVGTIQKVATDQHHRPEEDVVVLKVRVLQYSKNQHSSVP